MITGRIYKALSGFYYVDADEKTIRCKARGRFRVEKITPLVGDNVIISATEDSGDVIHEGVIDEILPRKNIFIRPPVANIDQMIILASAVNPITAPFLIDRIAAIAENYNCEPVICINKSDLDSGDELFNIYNQAGFITIRTSAVSGEGLDLLKEVLKGKVSAFTGNSGVGKSSLLNMLDPAFNIKVGEVSVKLGRGRHTTRHVELFKLPFGAFVADTPGFSAFNTEDMELTTPENIQFAFREFKQYIGECKYTNCAHIKEAGCAILQAVEEGKINPVRHSSYMKLYNQAKLIKEWEIKK